MADVIEVLEVRLGDATVASQKAKIDSSGNQYNVVTGLPALASGGNIIGSIANTGFNVTGSLPAGAATIGNVGLVAGAAAIGSVTVTSLPTLPSGTNVIGHVIADSGSTTAVTSLPAIPTGGNVIGSIANTAFGITGAIPAGTNVIGHVIADSGSTTAVTSLPTLPAGTNVIGHVIADTGSTTAVTSLPALPTGANTIGSIANTGFNVTGSLPAGTNLVGKFGIDQTTPGTTNAVQLSGPGTSLANPIYVSTEVGAGATLRTSGQLTSASLAAGASVTLAAPFVTSGKQGTLKHVDASSSVPVKVELQSVNNSSVATSVVTRFNSSFALLTEWREYVAGEFLGQAGADGTHACFAVKITNMDSQSNAADVFATLVWTEA